MPFPARNHNSDQIALSIFNALVAYGIPRGGNGRRFICTVTTGNPLIGAGEIYVATSGHAAGQLSNALATHAALTQDFIYTVAPIINADNLVNPLVGGAFHLPRPAGPYGLNNPPYGINGGRFCAEPKALIAAANSAYRISAMSTIWYGNSDNPYPDPANQTPDPTGHNTTGLFAVPCLVCRTNERYISMRESQDRNRARGANFFMEAPF
ncbi:hypothetical protein QN096_12365 [Metapseudomonas otitidis]|uniref:hypothetical protein n=1 Tax=Metapseudomonas otitidis TaxID=319939 RepID=UPI0025422BDE|nr:hypothetical protein [Pseudomonas otitidis]WIF69891.1 hypothetical protein QN096_12365 [Pseudomonas otitidis]